MTLNLPTTRSKFTLITFGEFRDMQTAKRHGPARRVISLHWAVTRLTSFARERAFEARLAEPAAVREELTIRQMKNAERVERAKERRLRAEEKALRAKAECAFLVAEGTRGDFARLWPSVFLEEVRSRRND